MWFKYVLMHLVPPFTLLLDCCQVLQSLTWKSNSLGRPQHVNRDAIGCNCKISANNIQNLQVNIRARCRTRWKHITVSLNVTWKLLEHTVRSVRMCFMMCQAMLVCRSPGATSTANVRPLPAVGTGMTLVEDPAERCRRGCWKNVLHFLTFALWNTSN